MTNFFIPLYVDLARDIGINEALFLAKLSKLLVDLEGRVDDAGQKWIRMTFDEWARELPFDRRTVIRIVKSVKKQELVETRTFRNRSLWYRIMYSDKLSLYDIYKVTTCHYTGGSIVTICHFDSDNLSHFLYTNPIEKKEKGKVEEKQPMEKEQPVTIHNESDLQALHNVFLDETQKMAPSAIELKSWYQFYDDILREAGNVELACEAIRQAIKFADGDNPQKKHYPIIDPGSITTPAGNWIAEYKREQKRQRDVNRHQSDLPEPEQEAPTPETVCFREFERYAELYLQPAQFWLDIVKPGLRLVGKQNGTLQLGVTKAAKDILDHRQRRAIERIAASIDTVDKIEFVEV